MIRKDLFESWINDKYIKFVVYGTNYLDSQNKALLIYRLKKLKNRPYLVKYNIINGCENKK